MTHDPPNERKRPAARRAAIGFRPCGLVPLPLLIMMVGCNMSTAMWLANPFVTASMARVLDGPPAIPGAPNV
jgi:hypothetical protein